MSLTGKLGNSKLSIFTTLQKVESSNAIAVNANNYSLCDNRCFKIPFAFPCRQFFMPIKPKISVFNECH